MPKGITSNGFERKQLGELVTEIGTNFKLVYGSNLDVSPASPNGQLIGTIAESFANMWEIAEGCYNAFNPNAAYGVGLSNLVQINAITRNEDEPSAGFLTLGGVPNTFVPEGRFVSSSVTGSRFVTTEDAIIGGSGVIIVPAVSSEAGLIYGLAGDIDTIDTPINGWETVTNALDFTLGIVYESDPKLRARRTISIPRQGKNTVDSIRAEVSAVTGVVSVTVLENDTDSVDVNGQAPYSVQVIALGGADAGIAEAILLKKPSGTPSFGTTTTVVQDPQGFPHDINWTRPVSIPIYVTVTNTADFDYPVDGDAQIAQAIVDYANSVLMVGRGFSLNDDVIYTELFSAINTVPNNTVTDLRIGTSPTPTGTANVVINIGEISFFTIANVVVI